MPTRFDWKQFLALLILLAGLVFVMFFGHWLKWA